MEYTDARKSHRPVSILEEKVHFKGSRLQVKTLRIQREDKVEHWETVQRLLQPSQEVHGVYIIALISQKEQPRKIVVIKQYRLPIDDYVLEFPGGFVHAGEPPSETAKREILEETGYTVQQVLRVSECKCTEGASVMFNLCRFVTVLIDADSPVNIDPKPKAPENEIELIEVNVVPLNGLCTFISKAASDNVNVMSELYAFSEGLEIASV